MTPTTLRAGGKNTEIRFALTSRARSGPFWWRRHERASPRSRLATIRKRFSAISSSAFPRRRWSPPIGHLRRHHGDQSRCSSWTRPAPRSICLWMSRERRFNIGLGYAASDPTRHDDHLFGARRAHRQAGRCPGSRVCVRGQPGSDCTSATASCTRMETSRATAGASSASAPF